MPHVFMNVLCMQVVYCMTVCCIIILTMFCSLLLQRVLVFTVGHYIVMINLFP